MNIRRFAAFFVLFFCLAFLVGCSAHEKTDHGKVQVYTTIFPLEDFAKKIGGKYVEVVNIIPAGVEPHDYEPSVKDLMNLSDADVFVYNGAGLETWIDKALEHVDQTKTVVVDTSKSLALLKSEENGDHVEHEHGAFDPHVWLDPVLAKVQAEKVKDALIKADPAHKKIYEQNFQVLAKQLDQLDREFRAMAKSAPKKEFVVSHAAFGYLAKRYGLTQIPISGISPSDEPSPQELKKIVETVKKHHVKYIFFETLVSSKIADVVKKEMNAEALTLNPLEGLTKQEQDRGEDYFSIMRKNKENLAKALGVTP
jgi:zinc transport system substrate-binding protein